MKERWRPIDGFSGYEVSDLGRLRSYHVQGSTTMVLSEPHVLNQHLESNGYLVVIMYRNQKRHTKRVHRLVLTVFVGPCPPKWEACHGPGGKLDNSLKNLSWGPKTKNSGKDRWRDGTILCGEKNSQAKLTESEVQEIRRLHDTGNYLQRELAEKFGVSRPQIGHVVNGKQWGHV